MAKYYLQWHEIKIVLTGKPEPPPFKERDIWWCALGSNIGVEIDGKNRLFERPVLILRKFSKEMFWGLPLTSQRKSGQFYYRLTVKQRPTTIILSQLRTLSSKRLLRHAGKINRTEYQSIVRSIISLLKRTP